MIQREGAAQVRAVGLSLETCHAGCQMLPYGNIFMT
jgi:hypothetical protein